MMPIEDAFVQIGSDTSRYWSTAQKAWVNAVPAGYSPVMVGTEQDIIDTLVNLGLGPLAPIPQPAPVDPLDALQTALIDKGVITSADVTAAGATLSAAPMPVTPTTPIS